MNLKDIKKAFKRGNGSTPAFLKQSGASYSDKQPGVYAASEIDNTEDLTGNVNVEALRSITNESDFFDLNFQPVAQVIENYEPYWEYYVKADPTKPCAKVFFPKIVFGVADEFYDGRNITPSNFVLRGYWRTILEKYDGTDIWRELVVGYCGQTMDYVYTDEATFLQDCGNTTEEVLDSVYFGGSLMPNSGEQPIYQVGVNGITEDNWSLQDIKDMADSYQIAYEVLSKAYPDFINPIDGTVIAQVSDLITGSAPFPRVGKRERLFTFQDDESTRSTSAPRISQLVDYLNGASDNIDIPSYIEDINTSHGGQLISASYNTMKIELVSTQYQQQELYDAWASYAADDICYNYEKIKARSIQP